MSPDAGASGAVRPGLRVLLRQLMSERLDPGRGAAAVFLGVTLGIVPIYGLQAVVALTLASLFRLNRPLTFAATFINNPVLQPFLLVASLQLGHLATRGSMVSLSPAALAAPGLASHLLPLFVGSALLSAAVGGAAAATTYVLLARRAHATNPDREWRRYVDGRFHAVPPHDRRFVHWKIRLDRIFSLLAGEAGGMGPAVDLGCGHGAALALLAFGNPGRVLHGCDLDAGRVETARVALAGLQAHVSVADVRNYDLPEAELILLIDVLQYLDAVDQAALLRRCAAALLPGGRLVFRLPDVSRGFYSWTTLALDRIILWTGGVRARRSYGALESYERLLADAGMAVVVRRYRNKLPLAHVVITATKAR